MIDSCDSNVPEVRQLARAYVDYVAAADGADRATRLELIGSQLESDWITVLEHFLEDAPDARALLSDILTILPATRRVEVGEYLIQAWIENGTSAVLAWLSTEALASTALRDALGGVALPPDIDDPNARDLQRWTYRG